MANTHPVRGVLAGVAGGLVAAWAMNQWSAGPGSAIADKLQSPEDKQKSEAAADPSGEDATMKAAEGLAAPVKGGPLTKEEKTKGGPMVHYTFGALMGGLYGGLAEYSPLVRSGFGTTFGSVLFIGGDLVAVPAFGLSKPIDEFPATSYAGPFTAHLVYGATTELMRRVFRAIL